MNPILLPTEINGFLGAGAGSGAPSPPLARSPERGDRIGESDRFEIVEKLGSGGMGHVFRAKDGLLDRTVAIKFILDSGNGAMPTEQLIALLRREAKATARLNHENIVAIFDMDAHDGAPFLVMELLDGQSLGAMMDRARLSPLRATVLLSQVVRGLSHAHAQGIIHRDLKPSNVFVLRDGRAKILDFGISHLERPAAPPVQGDVALTASGVGTPAFMAPEQWRGEPQDARTDIWAAGVMFYQMLTGRLPFTVCDLLGRFRMRHVSGRTLAPSARLLVPGLPAEADRVVATALREDPEGRFQTASELLEALGELEHALRGAPSDADVASRPGPRVERRLVTLLACCLEGAGSLDLDDVAEMDQRFYRACADAVKRADGTIGTPIGGSFFCCFGYPAARESDAQRAVRAAWQAAQAMREHARPDDHGPAFKIGVHTGVVGLPNMPGAAPGLPAMQGDAPNMAARIARGAGPSSVVVSQATLELTSGLFLTDAPRASHEATGGEPPLPPTYTVLGEVESASRFDQAFMAHLTPFVGREAELAFLRQHWERTKEGHGRVVVVSGEPGIGKSRLVQTLRERVIEENNTRFTCQCWPHFKNSALHPLIELVVRSVGIHREDSPEARLSKLEDNLATLGFSLPEVVPLFGSLLSIRYEERHAPLSLGPAQQKVETLEALVSMLLRAALSRPVLFVVEDLQWVDHSTIEFLSALIDRVPASRILVVLTSRPELRVPWSARRHLHQISLDRLSSATTAAMARLASKERELPAWMIERLVATTDGVPLFVEELTRMVVESWQPREAGPEAPFAIPGTLHELLLARLDRLRGPAKEVAQIGSIFGRDFRAELLSHVAPLDEMSLQEGLETLVEAGIVHRQGRPPDARYVFKHALMQQTAYQSMVKSERQRHHQRTAHVLTRVFPRIAELQPELIAHHHAEAGNTREAIAYWQKAGHRATQRSALNEAIDHYTRAREALKTLPGGPERDREELEILLALGSPLMSVHGYATPEVERTYARARELARSAGGQVELFPAIQGLWQFYYVRGLLPTARELGQELLEIARRSGSSTFLLLAHRACASTVFLQGDLVGCRAHTEAGCAIYDMREHGSLALRTGHDPGVAHGSYLAWSLWMLGYPDQALRRVLGSVDLAMRLSHPLTIAYALGFAAVVRNCRGEHAEARALADEALEITREHKFALWSAWARIQRGWALAGLRDHEPGIAEMKQGIREWMLTQARVGMTFFAGTLAEMCLRAGNPSETESLLEEVGLMAERNDERFHEPEMYRLRGELLLQRPGGAAEAEADACFRHGMDLARAMRARSWELRLAMSRDRLAARHGHASRAREELRDVHAWFTEGQSTADLRAAVARTHDHERPGRAG